MNKQETLAFKWHTTACTCEAGNEATHHDAECAKWIAILPYTAEKEETMHFEQGRVTKALDRYPVLQYFTYNHLPKQLQVISKPFAELGYHLALTLPHGPETSVALRKLLESKDAAVRSALDLPKE